jgi:aspartyl-tRNA synthetase
VDVEMSFVQMDDVMAAVEGCVARIFDAALGVQVDRPFKRLSFTETMQRYGIDRPDTRFGLELRDVTEAVRETEFRVFHDAIEAGGVVHCLVVKKAEGAEKLTRKITDGLAEELKGIGAGGLPVTKVIQSNGGIGFSTGVAKFL